MRYFPLIAVTLAGAVAAASPALAKDADGAGLPTCSATVTDHCMQREHRLMATGNHAARVHHHHHARMHHHK